MPSSKRMTRKDFYLYNYRLIEELAAAKIRGESHRTFSELMDDTGIEHPAALSYMLSENRKLGRIKLIEGSVNPIEGYSILPRGLDYFVSLSVLISYLLGMHNADSATDKIIVEASKLADIFIKAPKIDLNKYR